MIKQVSEKPLIYEDEAGNRLEAEKVVCPKHKNEVWFVRYQNDFVLVKAKAVELSCDAWKKAVEEGQA